MDQYFDSIYNFLENELDEMISLSKAIKISEEISVLIEEDNEEYEIEVEVVYE